MNKKNEITTKTSQLSVRMHPEMHEEFRRRCHEQYATMANVAYGLICEYLKNNKKKN